MTDWYVWSREYDLEDQVQIYLVDTNDPDIAEWIQAQGGQRRAGTSYSTLWAISEPIYMLLCLRWPRTEPDTQRWISEQDC